MIDISNLDNQYSYKLKSLVRGNDGTIENDCNFPFKNLTIDMNSNCFICICDGWLPIPVGKVSDFNSIEEVMNSSIARELQQDVKQKKFTYCATNTCGIKHQNLIQHTFELSINIDESCNLKCPSCRRELIMIKNGKEFDKKTNDVIKIMSWLEKFDSRIHIKMSGNGDPLASNILRPLIKSYSPKLNQTFTIFSNGLLIKKQLKKTKLLDQITKFMISADAGSQKVYEDVRRPGKWKALIDNLEFLKSIGKNKLIDIQFVVQKKNYLDLENLTTLLDYFDCTASIVELQDWGTWNYEDVKYPDSWTIQNGTYLDQDVLRKDQSEHTNAIQCLRKISNNTRIRLSPMIQSLLNETK